MRIIYIDLLWLNLYQQVDFKWVKDAYSITRDMIDKLSKDEHHGYLLEVDVDYPKNLHDMFIMSYLF